MAAGEVPDPAQTETATPETLDRTRSPAVVPLGDAVDLAPGTLLGDTYRIIGRLGTGGMGVVYQARDIQLGRDVAIKVHRGVHGFERLEREAVAMAQLAHPNVVTVHGVGRVGGRPYVAMELVQGMTFDQWMAAAPRSWREVRDLMLAVAGGLAAAHDAGLVHRDLKPSNILVGRDHRPRVSDFGLVRVSDELISGESIAAVIERPVDHEVAFAETLPPSDSQPGMVLTPVSGLTMPGSTLGTPAYMAPEQHVGAAVDARADQFAFCLVLYEAVYGSRPWEGTNLVRLRAQMATDPPRPPPRGRAPSWLWTVLRRGLSRHPGDRFPDMRALALALRGPRRRPAMVLAGAAVVALAATAWAVWPRGTVVPEAPCAEAAMLSTVWNPAETQALTRRLAAIAPGEGAAIDRVMAAIDAWAQRWRAGAMTACREGNARAPELVVAGEHCRLARLERLRWLVARVRPDSTPAVVRSLEEAAAALPDVAWCADPARLAPIRADAAERHPFVAGEWFGSFGTHVVRVAGDQVWMVYRHDGGTILGTLHGDTVVGWWCEEPSRLPPDDAGELMLRFTRDADGKPIIDGRWRYGSHGDWREDWDMRWSGAEPSRELQMRFDDLGQFCEHPAEAAR